MPSLEQTLQCVAAVRTRFAAPDLRPEDIDGSDIWRSFRLFEVLRDGQKAVVEHATRMLHEHCSGGAIFEPDEQTALETIIDNGGRELKQHFQLALSWRKHVSVLVLAGS